MYYLLPSPTWGEGEGDGGQFIISPAIRHWIITQQYATDHAWRADEADVGHGTVQDDCTLTIARHPVLVVKVIAQIDESDDVALAVREIGLAARPGTQVGKDIGHVIRIAEIQTIDRQAGVHLQVASPEAIRYITYGIEDRQIVGHQHTFGIMLGSTVMMDAADLLAVLVTLDSLDELVYGHRDAIAFLSL